MFLNFPEQALLALLALAKCIALNNFKQALNKLSI